MPGAKLISLKGLRKNPLMLRQIIGSRRPFFGVAVAERVRSHRIALLRLCVQRPFVQR